MDPATDIIDHNGTLRKMGWNPPDEDGLKMRASRNTIQALRIAAGQPGLIPRSEWKPKEYVSLMGSPKDYILDQYQSGGCVGWSGSGSLMRVRALRGRTYVKLSGACLYAQINGGHDNGSNIIDSANALEEQGTCAQSDMDYPHIYSSQIPKTITNWYKEDQFVSVTNFDDIVTGILTGKFPQFPVYVGRSFENFSNGVAGYDKPPKGFGNHSVYGAGIINLNGTWYVLVPNSWDYTWGPFAKTKPEWAGCVLISEKHINDCAHSEDGYAHTSDVPLTGEE